MSLITTLGNELIRYNFSNGHIEYSINRGSIWSLRNSGSSLGRVRAMIAYGNELILCSDKGVFYSPSKGNTWALRSSTYKNFMDLQDCGREILALTDDGHVFYSTNGGSTWSRRR